ncbi:hypothetical protein BDN67DRAFT_1072219 [Paxillus ammoniavirescens]|nr:hypothetical protein BDN67DRAFT_1072219 [Paxillus ammoniavirescens]
MALPTTQVVIFEMDEGLHTRLQAIKPIYERVHKSAGVQNPPCYIGSQIENVKTGSPFSIDWDSYEGHQAVMNHPSYPEVIGIVRPFPGAEVQIYHVQFLAQTVALEKPVTEVLVLTLKAAENRAAVVDILSKISEASQKNLVFGQTIEDENKYIVVGGWPTVEAHWETVTKPDAVAALTKLYSLTTRNHLYHTKLEYYQL